MNEPSAATASVLLVEHHLPLANAVMRGLRDEGIDVHLARDEVDGEALARANPYALLVVDWHCPRHGGAALVRRWRQAGVTAPVLMLLPFANGADIVEASAAGADDFLPLPFSFADLLMRVRSWIKPSRPLLPRGNGAGLRGDLSAPIAALRMAPLVTL